MQLQINTPLIILLVIMAILGFGVGWLAYDALAPITAQEFIDQCDYWAGQGQWKVEFNTCVPISPIIIPDDVNITIPIRGD